MGVLKKYKTNNRYIKFKSRAMAEGALNTLVYEYLTGVNKTVADQFKKTVKPKAPKVGAPRIKVIYNFFQKNSPAVKRKLESNGSAGPVKKAKQENLTNGNGTEVSEDDSKVDEKPMEEGENGEEVKIENGEDKEGKEEDEDDDSGEEDEDDEDDESEEDEDDESGDRGRGRD